MQKKTQRPFMGKQLDTFPDSFVCFDIETTGLSPARDDIIEISAIKVVNNRMTDTFSELVRINRPLPPFIKSLTGITDEMLMKNGKSIQTALADFTEFTGRETVMGHNVRFDLSFIYDNCLDKLGVLFDNDYVDTLRIAKRVLRNLPHHKLDDLINFYGIEQRTLHRALGDVELTVKCYYKMCEQAGFPKTVEMKEGLIYEH